MFRASRFRAGGWPPRKDEASKSSDVNVERTAQFSKQCHGAIVKVWLQRRSRGGAGVKASLTRLRVTDN